MIGLGYQHWGSRSFAFGLMHLALFLEAAGSKKEAAVAIQTVVHTESSVQNPHQQQQQQQQQQQRPKSKEKEINTVIDKLNQSDVLLFPILFPSSKKENSLPIPVNDTLLVASTKCVLEENQKLHIIPLSFNAVRFAKPSGISKERNVSSYTGKPPLLNEILVEYVGRNHIQHQQGRTAILEDICQANGDNFKFASTPPVRTFDASDFFEGNETRTKLDNGYHLNLGGKSEPENGAVKCESDW